MTSVYRQGENFKSTVPFVRERFPSRMRADQSGLIDLMEAYYEWLETEGQVTDRIYSLEQILDVDYGVAEFRDTFVKEYMSLLPIDLRTDTAQFIKNIKSFYESKGRPQALKYLFRAVFNSDVEIDYPSDKLLSHFSIVEDQDLVIRLFDGHETPELFIAKTITGATSGSTAIVQNVYVGNLSGIDFVEVSIQRVSSTPFTKGEMITADIGVLGRTYGLISSVTVNTPGTNYRLYDPIPLATPGDGVGVSLVVSKVNGVVTAVNLRDPGSGYDSEPTVTITGDGTGATATAVVQGGRVTSVIVTAPGTGYTTASVSFSGGTPNWSAAGEVILTGSILQVATLDPGVDYDATAPTANMAGLPSGGSGAAITINKNVEGRLTPRYRRYRGGLAGIPDQNYNTLFILGTGTGDFTPGEGLYQYDDNDVIDYNGGVVSWDPDTKRLIAQKVHTGTFDKTRTFVGAVSGAEWTYDSPYSRPIRIDAGDNEVNNHYSYQIRSDQNVNAYRTLHKKNTHPAGMRFTGVVDIFNDTFYTEGLVQAIMYFYFQEEAANTEGFRYVEIDLDDRQYCSIHMNNHINGTIADNGSTTFLDDIDSGHIKKVYPSAPYTYDPVITP